MDLEINDEKISMQNAKFKKKKEGRGKKSLEITSLGEFDGGGSGDEDIAKELGDERKQAVLFRKVAIAERSERTAEIDPQERHF